MNLNERQKEKVWADLKLIWGELTFYVRIRINWSPRFDKQIKKLN